MAIEKRLPSAPPQLFTANGTIGGKIEVASTDDFKVQQIVKLQSTSQDVKDFQVKRIISATEMFVGDPAKPITDRSDLSVYITGDGAFVFAIEQNRPSIPFEEYMRAMFCEEPTVAMRSSLVDKLGNKFDSNNPLPVSVDKITIDNVDIKLKHNGVDPQPNNGDTVAIGNNKTGAASRLADVNPDKKLTVTNDGVYDATLNLDPTNTGLVSMVRDDTPVDSQQIRRVTGAQNAAGTIRTVDISLLDEDGEPFTEANPLHITGDTADKVEPKIYKIARFEDSGSADMDVDGSGADVEFDFTPGGGELFLVEAVSFVIIDPGSMDATDFGSIVGLSTGLKLEAKVNGGAITEIMNIKDNVDIATHFRGEGETDAEDRGFLDDRDQYRGIIKFIRPILLDGSKSDFIRWVVRDNLVRVKVLRSSVRMWRFA